MHLRNNGLNSLPPSLFKKCWRLTTLDLHGTRITNDNLRQHASYSSSAPSSAVSTKSSSLDSADLKYCRLNSTSSPEQFFLRYPLHHRSSTASSTSQPKVFVCVS